MTWNVEFEEAAAKELRKLDHQIQREILAYFRQRIATDKDPRLCHVSLQVCGVIECVITV